MTRFPAAPLVFAAALVCGTGILIQRAMSEPSPATVQKEVNAKASSAKSANATPTEEELRKRLTPIQYAVTRQNATERPFTNEYWKHNAEGIYVDIISGKPLFSSKDKFDTDCGWPGFARPIDAGEIKELTDKSHGMARIEVRSKTGDAHLGHVFDDGPKELGGLRYCINSAAIRFVPKEKMAEAGYGEWLKIFASKPNKDASAKANGAEKTKGAQ